MEDIRDIIKNYRTYVSDRALKLLEIKERQKELQELEPRITSILSGMPFGSDKGSSKTEAFVIKIVEDMQLITLIQEYDWYDTKINTVDALVLRLNKDEREYISYYLDGISNYDLRVKFGTSKDSVKWRVSEVLKKLVDDYDKKYFPHDFLTKS